LIQNCETSTPKFTILELASENVYFGRIDKVGATFSKMRGALFAVAIGAATMGYASESACEGTYRTIWNFRVSYSTGQFSESTDETSSASVLMPSNSPWTCRRTAAGLTKSGWISAGYTCTSGSAWVNAIAMCPGTTPGSDQNAVQLGNGEQWANLMVKCTTVAPVPTPKPPADRGI